MTPSKSLFQKIKLVRSRTAEELPQLCSIGIECISAIRAAKGMAQTRVEHKGRAYSLVQAGFGKQVKIARPIRDDLFIWDPDEIRASVQSVCEGAWDPALSQELERLLYTVQQSVAIYLDLFWASAARKVVGTFFEAVIACALNRVSGLTVGPGSIRIPDVKQSVSTDLGLSRGQDIVLLAATKTSTRERLSQPFVQKRILDQAFAHPPKSILIVIGDVQRIGPDGVQHTFTAGQFLLYWKYVAPLDGVFYIDVPPQAETQEFHGLLKPLRELFASDLSILIR